jgi:hypothetical protein
LNINKTFTSKDFIVDFYDTVNYVKCYLGSNSIQNATWDSTLGWILGFRVDTQYPNPANDAQMAYITTSTTNPNEITYIADTTLSTNLYNYFMISLDDYNQNRLNDGLITVTEKDTSIPLPSYASRLLNICPTSSSSSSTTQQTPTELGLTLNQQYAITQIANSNTAFNENQKKYSSLPFVDDVFGLIPLKLSGLKNGDYFIEYGGTLQQQERSYFGPVNIYRITVSLLTDRGDLVNLNNSNWSFSLICEQLYNAVTNTKK